MDQETSPRDVEDESSIVQWEIPEYHKYPHGRRWYILAIFFALAVLAYALWTENYIFALLTILTFAILIMHEVKEPRTILFAITDKGVIIENRLFPYKDIERFWVVEPGRENEEAFLYMDFRNFLRPRVSIPMQPELMEGVRELLSAYVEEDEGQDNRVPFTDTLGRWFKI